MFFYFDYFLKNSKQLFRNLIPAQYVFNKLVIRYKKTNN